MLAALPRNAPESAREAANALAGASSLADVDGRENRTENLELRTANGTVFAILVARWEQSMSDVRSKSLGRPTLYALILVGLYLTYLVLSPFLAALTWAVIFAILFHDMQAALARRIGPNGAAALTLAVVAVAIVLPAALLVSAVAREAPQLTAYVKQSSQSAPGQVQKAWETVRAKNLLPMSEDAGELMKKITEAVVGFVESHAGGFVSDSLAALGNLAVMLFALFFMLRDGDAMRRMVRERLPFSEHENERLMSSTRDMVTASFGAGVIVAAAQGVMGGLAFWLLGLGAPAFWGIVTAFASLLPVGATIVWVPAGLVLLLSGDTTRGLLMLLFGAVGISGIDNWLRPMLLSGKTSASGLVVFFGLLGGGIAFGLIGLVIGPIVLVITGQLLEDLRHPDRLGESAATPDEPAALATRAS